MAKLPDISELVAEAIDEQLAKYPVMMLGTKFVSAINEALVNHEEEFRTGYPEIAESLLDHETFLLWSPDQMMAFYSEIVRKIEISEGQILVETVWDD